MPINRGFQSDLTYTKRTVKRFVSPAPYCKWPQRPLFRVKKCKTTFHILYTNIQILFLNTDWKCISVYTENGQNIDKHKVFSRFANWNIQIYR